jgi:class 3 adenylate cyclase
MLVVFRRRRPPPITRSDTEWKRNERRKKSGVAIVAPPEPGIADEDLSELIVRAAACNLTLLTRLNNFRPVPDVCLSLHCGIGAGQIVGLFVGGVRDLWEFYVAGEPIEQMSIAGEEAKAGEVMLSPYVRIYHSLA